jgi:hypothetical protein
MRFERDIETPRARPSRRRAPGLERPRRFQGDRGAILAEAAFVTPVFMVLMIGILEFGGAFRDYLTLNNATTAAARQASISANSADADYQILKAIKSQSKALPSSEILHIVVFHPATPTSSPTSGCIGGTGSSGMTVGSLTYVDACNVYTATSLTWSSASSNFGCGATASDRYWCPTNRKFAETNTQGNGPPDYVGIYIQIKHPYITGLFGSSITMSKTAIIKIEPQSLS